MASDWKAFAEKNTFRVELDGCAFLCARPSASQLVARGVLPAAVVLGRVDPRQAQLNGDRHRILLDEKAQDALIDAVLIEPKIWDGPFQECPDDSVPRRVLNTIKDALVLLILGQLYDTEVVRGAAFRDEGGDAPGVHADLTPPAPDLGGSAVAPPGRAGRRSRRGG